MPRILHKGPKAAAVEAESDRKVRQRLKAEAHLEAAGRRSAPFLIGPYRVHIKGAWVLGETIWVQVSVRADTTKVDLEEIYGFVNPPLMVPGALEDEFVEDVDEAFREVLTDAVAGQLKAAGLL